jgi:hypothetical protein
VAVHSRIVLKDLHSFTLSSVIENTTTPIQIRRVKTINRGLSRMTLPL